MSKTCVVSKSQHRVVSLILVILRYSTTRLRSVISKFKDSSTWNSQIEQNINTVNIMATIFISYSQDTASVVKSGQLYLTTNLGKETKVLTLSLYIPSLLVRTVQRHTLPKSTRVSKAYQILQRRKKIGFSRNDYSVCLSTRHQYY